MDELLQRARVNDKPEVIIHFEQSTEGTLKISYSNTIHKSTL